MDLKDMHRVEHLLIGMALADTALFAAGYFWGIIFFYGFLICTAALLCIWIGFWRCPHCGQQLWWNFDLPCKHCGEDIYRKPAPKPINIQEHTGFFGW